MTTDYGWIRCPGCSLRLDVTENGIPPCTRCGWGQRIQSSETGARDPSMEVEVTIVDAPVETETESTP